MRGRKSTVHQIRGLGTLRLEKIDELDITGKLNYRSKGLDGELVKAVCD